MTPSAGARGARAVTARVLRADLAEALLARADVAVRERIAKKALREDRVRAISAQALATVLAAEYLDRPAERVAVARDARGRPCVVAESGEPIPVFLSLAHAGDRVAAAIAACEIGIDIEVTHAVDAVALGAVAQEHEVRAVEDLAPPFRQLARAALWTCKEAYGKMTGEGLTGDLRTVSIRRHTAQTWVGRQPGPPRSAIFFRCCEIDGTYSFATCVRSGDVAPPVHVDLDRAVTNAEAGPRFALSGVRRRQR